MTLMTHLASGHVWRGARWGIPGEIPNYAFSSRRLASILHDRGFIIYTFSHSCLKNVEYTSIDGRMQ